MKKLHYILLLFSIILLAEGCKKKDTTPTILGFWTGMAVNTSLPSTYPISILYKSNNIARLYFLTTDTLASANIDGTVVIGSDSIRTTYVIGPNTVEYVSKLNSAGTQMTGTFRSLTVSTIVGTWSITKQP